MTNVVCERLGITYPILQGPMAWASDSNLAAAVSNAGGLGILGIGSVPVDVARDEIRKTKELTGRPFGFNLYAFLPTIDAMADMLLEEGVPVVEIGTLPALFEALPGHVARLRADGVAVIGKAASVEEAVAYERAGVDFIAIKGADGGGHIFGFTGTFSLLPQVVDAVVVPVINGGGVADGRGVAASFMLGAQAVEMGSRFLLAHECPAHENYKRAVLGAKEGETVLTGSSAVMRSGSCPTACRRGFIRSSGSAPLGRLSGGYRRWPWIPCGSGRGRRHRRRVRAGGSGSGHAARDAECHEIVGRDSWRAPDPPRYGSRPDVGLRAAGNQALCRRPSCCVGLRPLRSPVRRACRLPTPETPRRRGRSAPT